MQSGLLRGDGLGDLLCNYDVSFLKLKEREMRTKLFIATEDLEDETIVSDPIVDETQADPETFNEVIDDHQVAIEEAEDTFTCFR